MATSAPRTSIFATILMTILGCSITSPAAGDNSDSRAEIGFRIAEQQGITLDRDNPVQGLGSYLVNASGCNDCHTWPNYTPGGDPFSRQPKQVNIAGFLAGGRAFVLPTETVCSRNITPAPGTHMPAGLSRADFLYVIRTGCDPQDANFRDPRACELLQVMPWPNLQEMKKQELNAIYTFLSALPHVEPGAAKQCVPAAQGIVGE